MVYICGKNRMFVGKSIKFLFYFPWVYFLFFPFLRVICVGGEEAKDAVSFLLTFSPDLLLLSLIGFSFFDFHKWKTIYSEYKQYIWLYVLVIAYGLLMQLNGGFHIKSFLYGFRITYFPVMFYFLFRQMTKEELEDMIRKIFDILVVYVFASLMFHLFWFDYERYLIENVNKKIVSEYFIPRTGGFLLTPVLFAFLSTLGAIYFSYQYIFSAYKGSKILLWIKLIILLYGISFSVSRSGIVGYFLVLLLMGVLHVRYWKKVLFLSVLFYLIFSSLLHLMTRDEKVFLWIFTSTKSTVMMEKNVSRVELWKKSIQTLKNHPFGYGIGKAGAGAVKFFDNDREAAIYTTDGWILKEWNELGVLVGSIFLWMLWCLSGIKIKRSYWLSTGVMFYLLIFVCLNVIVNNVFDFYPYNVLIYLIMANNNFD